jgi:hypothetical protein
MSPEINTQEIFSPSKFGKDLAIMHILLISSYTNRKWLGIRESLTQQLIYNIGQLKGLPDESRSIAVEAYYNRIQEAEEFFKTHLPHSYTSEILL